MDKGTIIRTAALFLALINQVLVIYGKSPLPISSELLEEMIAAVFTTVTAIIAWFKNNYVTEIGRKQREIIEQNGLAKKKNKKQAKRRKQ